MHSILIDILITDTHLDKETNLYHTDYWLKHTLQIYC